MIKKPLNRIVWPSIVFMLGLYIYKVAPVNNIDKWDPCPAEFKVGLRATHIPSGEMVRILDSGLRSLNCQVDGKPRRRVPTSYIIRFGDGSKVRVSHKDLD